MKKLILVMLCGGFLVANANIKSIDIYKNRTFISQNLDLNKQKIKLLSSTKLDDVSFILPKGCEVLDPKVIEQKDDFSKQIVKKQQYINTIEAQIKSFENSIGFFKNISVRDVKSFDKLAKTSSYIHQESLKLYTKIEELKEVKKKYQEQLDELLKKRDSQKAFYLTYETNSCKESKNAYVVYNFNTLKKNLFYKIKQDTKDDSVSIKSSAFLTQSSGVDFENVTVNLYSYSYDTRLKPYKFYPQYLDLYERPVPYFDASEQVAKVASTPMKRSIKAKPSFNYIQSGTKSIFQAKNITLKSGIKIAVTFTDDKYNSKNMIQIDGFSTSKPFYKVEFKSKKNYMPMLAKFYIDGLYIGQNYLQGIKKDKKSTLYFGKDEFVYIKKDLIKDMKEEPFFSMNKLKTEKIYKYTITNKQDKIMNFELVERIPVSKHEDIKVKLISSKKFTKKEDNKGKIIYNFSLKPKEKYTLEFGYEVEKPNKKK